MRETVEQIISDADVALVHGRANFGGMTPRDVIAEGVLKAAFGYSMGSTLEQILIAHDLVTKPNTTHRDPRLKKRGFRYLRAAFPFSVVSALAKKGGAA